MRGPPGPSDVFEQLLPCGAEVDGQSAISCCEAAAVAQGFRVASRTRRSVLLMPGPRGRALFPLCGPRRARGGHDPAAGRGITCEIVADEAGEGLALCVAAPSGKRGEAFVGAVTAKLSDLNSPSRQVSPRGEAPSQFPAPPGPAPGDFRREAAAYYYFSKLLLDQQQGPGLAAADFVKSFGERYAQVGLTVDQGGPMLACLGATDRLCRLVEEFLSEGAGAGAPSPASLAADPAALTELRPWLRQSVERCLFQRVGVPLWRLYEGRHSAEDAQFARKWRALRKVSDEQLIAALEVKQVFVGSDAFPVPAAPVRTSATQDSGGSDRDHSAPIGAEGADRDARSSADDAGSSLNRDESEPMTPSGLSLREASELTGSTRAETLSEVCSTVSSAPGCTGGPYERAAAALTQVEMALETGRGNTPSGVLEALALSQLEMKTCALEASGGMVELRTMDDILPVFIFVLCRTSLSRPFACSRYMGDALSKDQRMEAEGQQLQLLESAARYIAYEWDIESLVGELV